MVSFTKWMVVLMKLVQVLFYHHRKILYRRRLTSQLFLARKQLVLMGVIIAIAEDLWSKRMRDFEANWDAVTTLILVIYRMLMLFSQPHRFTNRFKSYLIDLIPAIRCNKYRGKHPSKSLLCSLLTRNKKVIASVISLKSSILLRLEVLITTKASQLPLMITLVLLMSEDFSIAKRSTSTTRPSKAT